MRNSLLKLSLFAAALLAPAIAQAGTISVFTFTETNTNVPPTQNLSFSVATTPTFSLLHFSPDEFDFVLATSTEAADTLQFYDNTLTGGGGMCADEFCSNFGTLPQLFTGTIYNPTFISTTTPLIFTDAQNNTYSLTITPAVAATPEPSSFLLLGTGIVGIAGFARRRYAAARSTKLA